MAGFVTYLMGPYAGSQVAVNPYCPVAPFDAAADFEMVTDWLQTITLTERDGSSYIVPNTLRRAVNTIEAEDDAGDTPQGDTFWHLSARLFPAEPSLGSTIEDCQGRQWTVLAVDEQTMSSRWRCLCRRVRVRESLTTLVDHLKPIAAKGPHGASELTWSDYETGLRAKITPVSLSPEVQYGARFGRASHRMLTESSDTWGVNDRVRDSSGNLYSILGIEQEDQIGSLMAIDLEILPWALSSS